MQNHKKYKKYDNSKLDKNKILNTIELLKDSCSLCKQGKPHTRCPIQDIIAEWKILYTTY